LGAVVIVYSIGLIKPAEFREILSIRRTEFTWALTAFAGVVLVGTLQGIIIAIVVSLVALAHQVADPPVYVLGRKPGTNVFRPISQEHPEDERFRGLLLLRFEGRIFFANAEHIAQKAKLLVDEAQPKIVVFDLSGVFDLEYTVLKRMLTEAEKRQRQHGIGLWLVGMNPHVLEVIHRSHLSEVLGRDSMHFNLETAVAAYMKLGVVVGETP
jgi:sulfate permease, SulP family